MGDTTSKVDTISHGVEDPPSYQDNGVIVTQKIKRSELSFEFPPKSPNVIGLDFGTSTLAVSYVTDANSNPTIFKIHEEEADFYAPTVLLIDQDHEVEIGINALRRYTDLEVEIEKSVFFDKVKLELQHNKSIDRDTKVKSFDGTEYYLIDVIATILQAIKNKLRAFFKNRPGGYKIENFDWAVTVPALWGIRARDMMREAGYLAGLCDNCPDYSLRVPLHPASTPRHTSTEITNLEQPHPDKLSLIFEPEAAAVTCIELETQADSGTQPRPGPNDCYLTVDIGGGTIDITAHQVCEDGTMKILDVPHGRIYGGTEINRKFKEFLGKEVFDDPTFSRYLESITEMEQKERCAELFGFINREFESAKKKFGSDNEYTSSLSGFYNVRLPPSMVSVYRDKLQSIQGQKIEGSTHVSYRRVTQQISISKKKMKDLFEENVTKTKECIEEALEKVGRDKVKIIYLVGGFGGCRYMTSSIEHYYNPQIEVFRPFEAVYAVTRGACLIYNKEVRRIADATYGTCAIIKYDENNPIHKPAYKIPTDCGTECKSLFNKYIEKGEQIDPEFVYSSIYTPLEKEQRRLSFPIYSTQTCIHYVRKEDDSLADEVDNLGYLHVDISNGMHLPRENRKVQFVLDFSSTEIRAYGWFIHDKTPVKTTCDFLSTIENIKKFAN